MSLLIFVVGLLFLSLPVLVLVWGFRTCRALWRQGTTPWGRLVYNYGVRGAGIANAVAWTVLGGYLGATVIETSPDGRHYSVRDRCRVPDCAFWYAGRSGPRILVWHQDGRVRWPSAGPCAICKAAGWKLSLQRTVIDRLARA
jgi:hypothetical protein